MWTDCHVLIRKIKSNQRKTNWLAPFCFYPALFISFWKSVCHDITTSLELFLLIPFLSSLWFQRFKQWPEKVDLYNLLVIVNLHLIQGALKYFIFQSLSSVSWTFPLRTLRIPRVISQSFSQDNVYFYMARWKKWKKNL